jgi:hypothetical protein
MKAMNASLMYSPLFCEQAQRSLDKAFKARKTRESAVLCDMWDQRETICFKNKSEQSYQILSFTLKIIWWCAFIDAMVNDGYSRLHLGEYAKL